MRIAFCGASGTGKTTLARYLARELGLTMEEWPTPGGGFESTTRYTARQLTGEPLPYKVDETGQRPYFQRQLLENKLEWEAAHKSFVTDRTHLDNLAYSIMHDIADTGSCAAFWGRAVAGMANYDVVFFMPIRPIGADSDPARKQSPEYQKAYASVLRGLLGEIQLPKHLMLHAFPKSYVEMRDAEDYVRRMLLGPRE